MPTDNYDDGGGADAMTATAETATMPEDQEADGKEPTALIPKSLLAGKEFKPGEEVVLKIVRMLDDQVEVEYATGDESKEPAPEPAGEPQGTPAGAGNPNYD